MNEDQTAAIRADVAARIRAHTDSLVHGVGGHGTSPDGLAEVTLNGLGDLADLRITGRDIPPRLAARISAAVTAAWRAAGQANAQREIDAHPQLAEQLHDLADHRFRPVDIPTANPPARVPEGDEETYFGGGFLI